jgi:hypothetical protein
MVTDSAGTPITRDYSVLVNAGTAVVPVVNPTPVPPAGTLGVAYAFTFTAHDGTGPYTWSSAGGLPAGLLLNPVTGLLAGTPTTTGTSNFTITATNGSGPSAGAAFSIMVGLNPVTIVTATVADGSLGVLYDQTIQATGGLGSTFTWSVSAGALPPPLTLTSSGRVATIIGTPGSNGTFNFTIRVQNGASGAVATQAYSVQIFSPGAGLTATTPSSPPTGTLGSPYSLSLTALGGSGPYTWAMTGGALPTGLTLNTATGLISGTPTAAGSFQVTVRATAGAQSGSQSITINIAPPPLITTATPLPTASSGLPYFEPLALSGGAAPFTWTVSAGTLPAGLALDSNSGAISGTPTAASPGFDVTVTDVNGSQDVMTYTLPFASGAGPLTILGNLPAAHPGVPYSVTLQSIGGTAPVTITTVPGPGSLPVWLHWDALTNTLYGTPDTTPIGTIQVQATDATPVTPQTALTNALVVVAPLDIQQTSLGGGAVGSSYSATLTATGATGTVVWTLSSGSLPAGLSVDSSTGTISGTLLSAGTTTFQVLAVDGSGQSTAQQFTVTVGGSSGGGGGGGGGLLGAELLLLYALRRRRA